MCALLIVIIYDVFFFMSGSFCGLVWPLYITLAICFAMLPSWLSWAVCLLKLIMESHSRGGKLVFALIVITLATTHLFQMLMDLLNVFLIFPCYIIFLIIIVLHLLLSNILELTSVANSVFVSTNSILEISSYSSIIYFTWTFVNCTLFWAVVKN